MSHAPIGSRQPPVRPVPAVQARPTRADLLLALVSATLGQRELGPAAVAFCVELARTVGAARVAIGAFRRDTPRLLALSDGARDTLDRHSAEAIGAAMQECGDQAMTLSAGVVAGEIRGVDAATRRLRQFQQGGVIVVPLVAEQAVLGAVSVEFAPRDPDPGKAAGDAGAELIRLCEDMVVLAAPHLLALQAAERPFIERLGERWRRLTRPGALRRLKLWQWLLIAFGCLLVLAAVVPTTVSIGAPARVEGAVERVIAAPVDGFIKSAAVRPGDLVTSAQIVAELIDRDLQLERSRHQAEITQHENALMAAMARSDRSEMMIHQARLGEARAQAALIDQQLDRIQMRAPIDGLIIHGDLTQMLGAPVAKGDVLMTVAPRHERRVIVEVDERDIELVRVGQSGRLSVAALPWDWTPITVRRITPMAQVVEGRNAFEVEAAVAAGSLDELRPGLRGVARLVVGREPPLWTWSRRLRDHLQRFVWRWLP